LFLELFGLENFLELAFNILDDVATVRRDFALEVSLELSYLCFIVAEKVFLLH
jgi:hypothetical protein